MSFWISSARIKISHKYRSARPSHWFRMTEPNNLDINKKLSKLKQIAIDIVSGIQSVLKNRDIINQRLEEGRALGFSDIEIGDAIRRESKGKLSDRTVRYYLPDTAKHTEKINKTRDAATLPHQQVNRRLVVPEEPTIPPLPEVVREAEIVREPPKPVNEPISIPQKIVKILFDPAPIDRDRTQVFIIHYDIAADKIKKYETVGRRTIEKR